MILAVIHPTVSLYCKGLVTKLISFLGQNSFEAMHLAGDLQRD